MAFVRVLCVLMIAVLAGVLSWEPMREYLAQDSAYFFFWGMIGVFLLLFVFSFYAQRRPRIEADGQNIAFYPMWRPSKRVTLSEITTRKEKADCSDPNQAAMAGVLGGALGVLLIHAATREMENLEQFDSLGVPDELYS